MPPKIFYQSSMPRAGSTLLQNILAQNPDFYVTPTSGLLELVFGARLSYTNSAEFKAQDSALKPKPWGQIFHLSLTRRFSSSDAANRWHAHCEFNTRERCTT